MADLQVCYFCGSGPDSSLGEYAVVPPALAPTEDHQQSVVLCPDCRGKLTTVMEPVVDAAEAYAGSEGVESDEETVSSEDQPDPDVGDPTAGDAIPDPGMADSPVEDATDEHDPSSDGPATGTDDGVDVPPTDGDDERDDVSMAPGSGTAGAADPEESEDLFDGGPSDGEEAVSGSNAPRDQPHADDELVGRNNDAYNKTLRLLQNREFPVQRHEIEQVAANAYQLDPQEVSDAIDSLIQKGLLTQEGAQLLRP